MFVSAKVLVKPPMASRALRSALSAPGLFFAQFPSQQVAAATIYRLVSRGSERHYGGNSAFRACNLILSCYLFLDRLMSSALLAALREVLKCLHVEESLLTG